MIATTIALLSGVFTWTLLEYSIHRWLGHRAGGTSIATREHLQHHVGVSYFSPAWRKILAALPVLGALGVIGALVTTVPLGITYAAGVALGWTLYEILHRRIHVAAPLNAYGRWARRHHLAHHFTSTRTNHGVTSPLWDVVFGTFRPSPRVKVPARHAEKFPWLLSPGEDRTVTAALAADFYVA